AARRARGPRRAAVACAAGALRRRSGGSGRGPRRARGAVAARVRPRRERHHERALPARQGRRRAGRRAARAGLRLGDVPARVPAAGEGLGPARDGRVAHDPGDRRRRAGPGRPGRLPGAAGVRARAAAAAGRAVAGAGRNRGGVRRDRRAFAHVRGVPGRSPDVDAARRRRGPGRRGSV
ncbi:MAG: hypothetical protein AVDCRST_MAG85-3757, partial [uncultured Solirubrobacteraceae bacterium]